MKSLKGSFCAVLFWFLNVVSIMSFLFLLALIVIRSANLQGSQLSFVAFSVFCICSITAVLSSMLDDPNRFIRHAAAIVGCVLAFHGKHSRRPNMYCRKFRKELEKRGSYIRLYKKCLHSWDVVTWNRPTSKYSCKESIPTYGKYRLEEEFRKALKLGNKRGVRIAE